MSQNPLFSLGGSRMKVELDKKSLFALASDTRLEILKSLQPMRRTMSQLSESLDIDKAAIHRHLKKMEEGGLVVRYEDHGFVYYGLSWKARDLLSPNDNTRIIILLSTTAILAVLLSFFITVGLAVEDIGPMPKILPKDTYHLEERYILQLAQDTPAAWILPALCLGLLAFLLGLMAFRILRRTKQRIDPAVESSEVQRPAPED